MTARECIKGVWPFLLSQWVVFVPLQFLLG